MKKCRFLSCENVCFPSAFANVIKRCHFLNRQGLSYFFFLLFQNFKTFLKKSIFFYQTNVMSFTSEVHIRIERKKNLITISLLFLFFLDCQYLFFLQWFEGFWFEFFFFFFSKSNESFCKKNQILFFFSFKCLRAHTYNAKDYNLAKENVLKPKKLFLIEEKTFKRPSAKVGSRQLDKTKCASHLLWALLAAAATPTTSYIW